MLSATIFPTYWNYFICSVCYLYFIMSTYVIPNCIALIQSFNCIFNLDVQKVSVGIVLPFLSFYFF